jgi:putative Holliday junction resolvase
MTQHTTYLGLDLGDRWIGVAISDPLGMFARPLTTVAPTNIDQFLSETLAKQTIATVVVGYPKTLRGTESEQTKKVLAEFDRLKALFTQTSWQLVDERFSSQQATKLKKEKTKEDKIKSHALAAAFILQNYLEQLRFARELKGEQ